MKKMFGVVLAVALVVPLAFGSAFAMPSAKGSAAIGKYVVINAADQTNSWHEVMWTYISVPNGKELVFDVALQCNLMTDTLVKSKGGKSDTSEAMAAIEVRVKYQPFYGVGDLGDAKYAHPGGEDSGVIYAKRTQRLMAKFGGIYTCTDDEGDGVITLDECVVTEEELQLMLHTINANAFNFIAPNLPQGDYKVTVEAKITSTTSSEGGSANATGLVGMGSMVVDEVRFIKGDTGGAPAP